MARRIHTPRLRVGQIRLDATQAHHVRDVLRLSEGGVVEVFDDNGAAATGVLVFDGPHVAVRVERVQACGVAPAVEWAIASAVPKGERADWMIEKLSELGTSVFIPLAAARSVVLPEGKNKRERWMRIATEAAKQSRRHGVMRIEELTTLQAAVARVVARDPTVEAEMKVASKRGWYLSPAAGATPMLELLKEPAAMWSALPTFFIGPEGGWSPDEIRLFQQSGFPAISLTSTILRMETAAIAAATLMACAASTSVADGSIRSAEAGRGERLAQP